MLSSASATSENRYPDLARKGLVILFCLSIFMIGAGIFATTQAIWTDETTQLSGLKLPFFEQLFWLTGNSDINLGVPPDRMPPLSYWLGTLWAYFFGVSEISMRWFGIVAVSTAAPAIYMTGRAAGGRIGGYFMLLLLFSSPMLMVQSVEIRAYPLFFTFSAWAIWCFSELILSPKPHRTIRQYVLFGVFLLLAAYTHFFGMVAAACLLTALFVHHLWLRYPISPVLVTGGVVLVLSLGLAPFILAAVGVSGEDRANVEALVISDIGRDAGRLGFRLFFHPVVLSVPVILAVNLLGIGGLICLSFLRGLSDWTSRGKSSSSETLPALVCILLPLIFAFLGLPTLKLLISSFDVLAPHYNIWMIPITGILLSFSFQSKSRLMKRLSMGLGIMVILGNLVSTVQLLRQATLYSHGPGEWINDVIKKPSDTLIIHDAAGVWGNPYFSLFYLTNGEATQWLRHQDGRIDLILKSGLTPVAAPQSDRDRFSMVIEMETRNFDSRRLAKIAAGKQSCEFQTDWIQGNLPLKKIEFFCAYAAAARKISIK